MKKFLGISIATIAVLAFCSAAIFAEETKPADSKKASCAATCTAAKAMGASEKGGCPMMKQASATTTDAATTTTAAATGHDCSKMTAAECAKMSPEECAKLCGGDNNCEMVSMSIKGMTCTGCEQGITTALMKLDGVKKVVSISHKEGSALVCIDPTKVKGEALVTAVVDKGYQAEIIPAVATTTTSAAAVKGHVCSPENKAACASKADKADKASTDEPK